VRGQASVDLMIAVTMLVFSIVCASYTIMTMFTPYSGKIIDLEASAYRCAMILCEDAGLWVTNYDNTRILTTNWYKYLSASDVGLHLKRIGLANSSTSYLLKLSYEVRIPCYLNESKVITFFNSSIWKRCFGSSWLSEVAKRIGIDPRFRYNISLRYMNGSVMKLKGEVLEIGYPLPSTSVVKFERLVTLDKNGGLRRLIVYVW